MRRETPKTMSFKPLAEQHISSCIAGDLADRLADKKMGKRFCWNVKKSKGGHSKNGACYTQKPLLKLKSRMSRILR
ncbi:MAG: hypothetical protein AB7P23_10160 [Amphiplicatus sp.]